MKDSTRKTSIIRDTAIFDYVAGHQSDGARQSFERSADQDECLMQDIMAEKELHNSMNKLVDSDACEPVSMDNFDALLTKIEADESELMVESVGKQPGFDNVIIARPWRWQRQFNIAASFGFVAMIGLIGFELTTEPKFVTLSNETTSEKIDFMGLVEQQRLIKLEFSKDVTPAEIGVLLERYQLSAIQPGPFGQVVLVSAANSVSAEYLVRWAADNRIATAELVSFGTE